MTQRQRNHLRIIPRLDVKSPNLVKGVRLEGFRVLGNPVEFASRYGRDGADEIIYQDIVASLYQRNNILSLVEATAKTLFVPLTVGGGLRTVDDIRSALLHGADRVVINTAAVQRPQLITEAAEIFGSQCVIVALEVAEVSKGCWEPLINTGRDRTNLKLEDWIRAVEDMGAGELLLTSVDRDGTGEGIDLPLLSMVCDRTTLPVVVHGGVHNHQDLVEAWHAGASGVALSSLLHYEISSIRSLKMELRHVGVPVRLES